MFDHVFGDNTVLVTGHTGFKGSWLCIWLKALGANVVGYALEPYTEKDNFVVSGLQQRVSHNLGDIRNFQKLANVFEEYQPEIVFHLAAQPIVRQSYVSPRETYEVNVLGTVNVLECCRKTDSVKVIINVTSDKCYENMEWLWGYRETDPMGGYDPYSTSKGCSELITASYRRSFFNPENCDQHRRSLASVRAGNVIGGGDWQKDRIVPDCIRALLDDRRVKIRNPFARRPWQHVLEPLSGYLLLASKMYREPRYSGAYNFGPDLKSVVTVGELADLIISQWGSGDWVDVSDPDKLHEAHLLYLETCKAQTQLKWAPRWDIQTTIAKTVEWYREFETRDPYEICKQQIQVYCETQRKGEELELAGR